MPARLPRYRKFGEDFSPTDGCIKRRHYPQTRWQTKTHQPLSKSKPNMMLPDISLLLLAGVMSADAHALPVVAAAAEAEPTTVGVFLGAKREGEYSFDASVIAADAVATTYQIRCQSGHLNMPGFPTTTCDQNDPVSCSPWLNLNTKPNSYNPALDGH